jgi:AcrR family transcriptional regulator
VTTAGGVGNGGQPGEVGVGGPPDAAEVRRSPYGRNPALAAHGVRARAEIIEAARELFARNGYQATTVESIGEATGRSGAAVYQYFEGKAEIFGIFLREAGTELRILGEQFPVLTDDGNGRLDLERWIADLIDLLTRHQATFLLWAQVQFNEPGLVEIGRWNLARFQTMIADRLQAAGAHPRTPNVVPLGMMSVVQWSYFFYLVSGAKVSRQRLEHAVADTLHNYLFAAVGSDETQPEPGQDVDRLPTIPLGDVMGLRRPVTARGVGTVQRILLAAADQFRSTGFYGTSLSDVAAAAGVSHGSVYTYWADRDSLFATLAQDAVAAVEIRVSALPAALQTADGLAGWLDGWVSMLDAHGSVLYVWTHEVDLPAIADLTARMNDAINAAAFAFVEASATAPMDDPEAMAVVLRAVLTDVPYVLSTQLGILPRAATYAIVADLLRAGVGAPAFAAPEQ